MMGIYEMLSSIYMTMGQTNACIIDQNIQNQRQELYIEMMSEAADNFNVLILVESLFCF